MKVINVVIIAFAALFALAIAAPAHPKFPTEGRTEFYFHDDQNRTAPHHGKWTWSVELNAEIRVEQYQHEHIEVLHRFNDRKAYLIRTPQNGQARCTVHEAKQHNLTLPNFSNFTYVGEVRRNGHVAEEWREEIHGERATYYDIPVLQTPLEIDYGHSVITFSHFEKTRLPASTFNIPTICNRQ
eukprot:TRINITY_DN28227_c0_g1_i1.p1 TRINITY_DN28227_c0_g1~~TRINITY_DN28227_c0_g1_i1.p1  ORF type:complete len:191 (+),score=52.79 TRINITY_DN28227_c0_g1_i1:22-573(+)